VNRQTKKRVLFVCLGNACRSQMAEAFAREYGSDVMIAGSAGLRPAGFVAPDTIRAMLDREVDIRDQFSKGIEQMRRSRFDIAIGMSDRGLPAGIAGSVRYWDVPDPIGLSYEEHCVVRDQIEHLVMDLILELRSQSQGPVFRGQGSGRLQL
jgi:arsenate reductase